MRLRSDGARVIFASLSLRSNDCLKESSAQRDAKNALGGQSRIVALSQYKLRSSLVHVPAGVSAD